MQACFFRSPEKSIQKPDTTASWTSSPHYISWRWHKSRLINKRSLLLCCFMFTEARRLIRDGDGGGKGTKEWRLNLGYRLKETRETVDCCQNNGSVKAVSPCHCPATRALHNCCFNCCVWAVTKTMSIALLLTNNSKRKKSNFHSPAPPPYSWSLVGYLEGLAPPPSSKISWSHPEPWSGFFSTSCYL